MFTKKIIQSIYLYKLQENIFKKDTPLTNNIILRTTKLRHELFKKLSLKGRACLPAFRKRAQTIRDSKIAALLYRMWLLQIPSITVLVEREAQVKVDSVLVVDSVDSVDSVDRFFNANCCTHGTEDAQSNLK
jgi:hypothetical protein